MSDNVGGLFRVLLDEKPKDGMCNTNVQVSDFGCEISRSLHLCNALKLRRQGLGAIPFRRFGVHYSRIEIADFLNCCAS